MVAVAPYLEESLSEPIEGAQRYVYKMDDAAQLGELGAAREDPLANPARSLDKTHQGLARLVASREVVNQILDGREMYVEFSGTGSKLVVNPPVRRDEAPPWAGIAVDWSGSRFLSWVEKMQCPSFSLPAGAFENGGSCPAASLGQTTASKNKVDDLVGKEQILRKTLGGSPEFRKNALPVWYALSTCQTCYAEGGTYGATSNILAQAATLAWTKWAIQAKDTSGETVFVTTLIKAIQTADYGTPSGADIEHLANASKAHNLPQGKGYKRFFRWHDAGDIIGLEYFRQIKRVCDHFNPRKGGKGTPTLFWIPTRIWATPGSQSWSSVNADPTTNIVLRPSAFHVNFPAPESSVAGPGNAAGSTTIVEDQLDALRSYFDHDCPAAGQEKATCVSTGCRACWVKPDLVINYRLH